MRVAMPQIVAHLNAASHSVEVSDVSPMRLMAADMRRAAYSPLLLRSAAGMPSPSA